MSHRSHSFRLFSLVLLFAFCGRMSSLGADVELPVPTHAEAALLLAKYTGLFDRYVDQDASLNDCVVFLNRTGVYFGLMEVLNGSEFALSDCARVMGQTELVLTGEAEFSGGKVKLPKDIDSWADFCILNNIDYVNGYQAMRKAVLATREIAM